MRIISSLIAIGLACCTTQAAPAATAGHDIVLEGRPLLQELAKPRYQASRCLLPPVLAANGRTVIESKDPAYLAGDAITAIDGETLNDDSPTALVDILEHRAPGSDVAVRVATGGSEHTVTTRCVDAKPYFAALRDGAAAAAADDAAACADQLDSAARLHGLPSIWLRLSMSCNIDAGRLSGDLMWRAEYALFRQRIREAQYTPALLKKLRHAVGSAAHDLEEHGNARLANQLRREYAAAAGVSLEKGGDD